MNDSAAERRPRTGTGPEEGPYASREVSRDAAPETPRTSGPRPRAGRADAPAAGAVEATPEPDTSEEEAERGSIITRLADLQRSLGRFFARDRSMPLMASTLTMQQFKVVMFLTFAGPTSGQELARHLGVGLATVTGIVDRVVAQGLVTRHEDPHDRRVRLVELTEAGRRLTSEIIEAGTGGYVRLLRRLDTETLRTMETVMRKIEDAMRELHAEETVTDAVNGVIDDISSDVSSGVAAHAAEATEATEESAATGRLPDPG
ncbi:MarR family transcriptional regulator [Microbispora sp. H10949]|uniref:MarR family winged helix-turn-helix transcriptional regulator n=1 Tax=Microbispora sp. H10949 TaxID=2729111 RepID=UPI002872E1E4|nr:MarR family transcriptional regulator [Microbispora sp. H10949]